tara:strand:+ start:3562 stop:5385 length:1824 start_codon:yes stop_codon:yes gene_type:complete
LNCGTRQCFTVLDADDRPLLVHNCWAYDPRAKHKVVPFIPWPHQEYVFLSIDEAIDIAQDNEETLDVLVDKSRAQGGTFGYLWVDLRRWLRDKMFLAGYVTRNEKLVDSKTDANTVLWKIQFALDMLPVWMVPEYERSLNQHTFINKDNGSTLVGFAAGQDVAAGGRATVFTMDEAGAKDFVAGGKDEDVMESLHDVTNCLRLVSARYIDQGVFHEACEAGGGEGGMHLILDWKDHPVHGKNKYIVKDGKAKAVKEEEEAAVDEYISSKPELKKNLERKGFKFEDCIRSPWYDMRCLRKTARPQLIASQLDRNPRGAVGKVFQSHFLEEMKEKHAKPPVWVGKPVFDKETLDLIGLIKQDDGPLALWFDPGPGNMPPMGPFTLGSDIALGGESAYASNSVTSGIDDRTGEQVLEYTVKGMVPVNFADMTVGLAIWMRRALLAWEDSGMSGSFAKQVMEVRYYGNVYYREVSALGQERKSNKPGWPCRDADKAEMFDNFTLGMQDGRYTPRSFELIKECGEYEWDKGKIIHAPTQNHGAKDKNHGDRCIAAAGAYWIYSQDKLKHKSIDIDLEPETAEYGSFKWREQQEMIYNKVGSPEYSIRDLLRS